MKTHYDVLNLDKNCSAKEIKDSFIRLSKKYHPDKNKSSEAHKNFVEVNEAYSVLGKPSSRHIYDAGLSHKSPRVEYKTSNTTMQTAYEHYAEMHRNNIRRNQDYGEAYFTKTKIKALCFCLFLMAVGSGLHMMASVQRKRLHSHHIAVKLKESRDRLRQERKRRELEEAMHKEGIDSANSTK